MELNRRFFGSALILGVAAVALNGVTTGDHLARTIAAGYWPVAGVDLALLTGGVNADPYGCSPHGCAGSARCGATPWPCSPHR